MTLTCGWRKSTHSGQDTNCIEISGTLDHIRDSKNSVGPTLRANVSELVQAIRAGRFDG